MKKERVIVYVDGFNFYYGLRKNHWRKFYWLDLVKLFETFIRPNQELVAVKYFSARPLDDDKWQRQNDFFQANEVNPKFQLILGKYLKKKVKCHICHQIFETFEEKESDVRIATQIVADALNKNCDVSLVVSADTDMIPAIDLALENGHRTYIYLPPNQHSTGLSVKYNGSLFYLERYKTRFKNSLLPDVVHLSKSNYDIHIPEKWKQYQNE